jgi:hypothetical protein
VNEDIFWTVISNLDWARIGDDDAVLAPAVETLSALRTAQIFGFQEILASALHALDTREHARWCYRGQANPDDGEAYISADDFLYARCVVVANGRDFYRTVLVEPKLFPTQVEFESLLYLAPKAYEQCTGDPWDGRTRCSYESFSNLEGWRATPATVPGRFTSDSVEPGNRRPG